MSGMASSRMRARRKETGLRRDSMSVSDTLGSTMRRGTPGMPAPAPMSRTRSGPRGRNAPKSSESRKSPRPISARVLSAVRWCARFQRTRRLAYRPKAARSAGVAALPRRAGKALKSCSRESAAARVTRLLRRPRGQRRGHAFFGARAPDRTGAPPRSM